MTDVSEATNGTIGASPKTGGKKKPKAPRPKVKTKAAKKKAAAPKQKKGKRGGKPGVAPGGSKASEAARRTHHKVVAGGKNYDSVFKAFEALKLPMGSHQTFRKKLKAAGALVFETESGKKVNFKLAKD